MGEKNRPGFACCAMRSAQTQRFHEPNVCTSRTRTLLTEKHATASSRREGEKVRSAPILRTCSWTVQTCSCVQATCPAPQHPCRVRRLRHCRQRLKTVRPLSHLSPHGRLRGRRGAAPISEWPTAWILLRLMHGAFLDDHHRERAHQVRRAHRRLVRLVDDGATCCEYEDARKGGVAKLRRDGMTIECAGRPPREMLFDSCSCSPAHIKGLVLDDTPGPKSAAQTSENVS